MLGTTAALVLATILVFEVDPGARQAAVDINEPWIPSIGVSFHIAIDGLNAILVLLTTFRLRDRHLVVVRDRELATPAYLFLLASARPRCSARSSPKTSRCSSSAST